jgi:hypothetical protein
MLVRYRLNMGKYCEKAAWSMADLMNRTINLTKNSQFYVRQGDVERLIAQGYLQKLN